MIFQIDQFESCALQGITDIKITYNSGLGITIDEQQLSSEEKAFYYCQSTAKAALTWRLERYLQKIRRIKAHGVEYWHTPGKEESFAWLWKVLPQLIEKELPEICKNIIYFKDRLWQIMPGEKHRCYKKLKQEVVLIIAFARNYSDKFYIQTALTKEES
jgi:hypothetical protein